MLALVPQRIYFLRITRELHVWNLDMPFFNTTLYDRAYNNAITPQNPFLSTNATPSDLLMFLLQPHLDADKTEFHGLLAFQMSAFQAEPATRRKKWKDGVDALYTCCALWGYGGKSVCMPNRIEAPEASEFLTCRTSNIQCNVMQRKT